MKKFLAATVFLTLITFCTALSAPLYGCAPQNEYERYVSVLRQDIYSGTYGDIQVSAEYGFKETPLINDGAAKDRVYGYTVFMPIIPDEIKRTVSVTINGETYAADLIADEISSEYKAFIETPNVHLSDFTAVFTSGSTTYETEFSSLLPQNALPYTAALDALKKEQKPLLDAFTENGVFSAELYLKIFVKNGKPFWYVGIAYGSDRLKALVIDGTTAQILAVREIA